MHIDVRRPLQSTLKLLSGQGAREGYLAAVDQGLISVANFLATLYLARMVNPTELGVYGVGFTTLRLVRSFQEGLTIQPMNAFGAALKGDEFRRYATSTSLIQVALAVGSAFAVAVLGTILTDLGNDVAGPAIFSLWFCFLFWQLQEYIRRILYVRGHVLDAMLNTALANGVRLGVMIWWGSQGNLSGIAGLNAIAWGSLVALAPGIWQTRAYWTRQVSDVLDVWKKNWDFGRWVLGGVLANWVSVEFYPVLTAGMISFAAAGAYRALQNLVAPVHLLLRAVDTFLTPRAARQYSLNGYRSLSRILRLTYLFAGVPILSLLGLAVLFRDEILQMLYGETYLAYSNGMILMAVFYALWFAYWPLQTAFKAARFSRPIFVANLVAIGVMFTAGIWMIWQWGVYGTIAGQALNAGVVAVLLGTTWLTAIQKNGGLSRSGRERTITSPGAATGAADDRSSRAASETRR